MHRCLFVLAMSIWTTDCLADDAAVVKMLTDQGAKVTIRDGVATEVRFTDCSKLAAAEFKAIGSLKGLKSLTLYGKCIGLNDETVPHLAGLTQLEQLGIDGMMLSDDGFRQLAPLQSLRSLSLFHVSFQLKGFTGSGFRHLKALPNLRTLTFAGTSCGEEAHKALAEVPQLRDLRTWHTWVGPEGASLLTQATRLTSLKYGQSLAKYDGKPRQYALTDATIPAFAKMTDLEALSLDEARLTYGGLIALKSMPKLKKLTLERIDIAEGDVQKLRLEMPKVEIVWKQMNDEDRAKLDRYLGDTKGK